ncbi:hypothetical protein FKG94_15785 [Exilibacterium tricleocarpae]|uniref:Uncharacterized protein n=1 Tax=Exilibacterium tricleocarpae TaxID=2591008 RepID=A0A545TFR7_9GAMM|nr:DUF6176 family protein [Exilibacterium tricleocarpae]TQV76069.1 hypothetical protein FKG94_15785 [Exilibacterium tricleocarpae]
MLKTQCLKVPIVTGREARVRHWLASLNSRKHAVLEAIRSEQIADEAIFYADEAGGSFLYLYARAFDFAVAAEAFQSSALPIDREFKIIYGECLDFEAALPLELLFAADSFREDTCP